MPNSAEKIGNGSEHPDLLPGTFDDDAVTRGLLADAIKRSEQSRDQIADRMSWLLSRTVTANMLNDFTADSKANHRFPFAWSRAFCEATGDWRLFHHLADQAGFILVAKDDADVVSLGELVIQQEQAQTEIKRHARNIIERRSGRL
jgi:hypothetical protein